MHDAPLHLQQSSVGSLRVALQNIDLALDSLELALLGTLSTLHLLLRLELIAEHRVLGLRYPHLDHCT